MPIADYHEKFAAVYDTMYSDRDIAADARYAAGLIGLDASIRPNAHVLDFGCGSGSHVLAFNKLGLAATGFDRSPAMIDQALAKPVPNTDNPPRFASGMFSEFCAGLNGHRFDGVVSIFQVFNCMESPADMLEHLRLIRSRITPGGRFLIDLWNGAAVFADDPRPDLHRYVCKDDPSKEIVRLTVPKVDRIKQRCTLRYRVLILAQGRQTVLTDFESVHELTFLTPLQYRHLFELADLTILDEFQRGHPGVAITDRDWYISYLLSVPK